MNLSAQVIAYPAGIVRTFGSGCVDLKRADSRIIGHQINVTVTYYASITEAENENNTLDRFYQTTSSYETVIARVDSNLTNAYDTAELEIFTPGPHPPPPGLCEYTVCDVDDNGSEIIYLNNLICFYGASFPDVTFCNSLESEIQINFYLSENDAINGINNISAFYVISEPKTIYHKIENTSTNQFMINYFDVDFVSCSYVDFDSDGIHDQYEDTNRNLGPTDDDTDLDGLNNFEDDDDDGDGILTVNEDYNNNGDPTDDDTDSSGVADYLEANVTLSSNNFDFEIIKIYPNPTTNKIFITSKRRDIIRQFTMYSISGNLLFESNKPLDKIDISSLSRGIYFLTIRTDFGSVTKKIIKN